MVRSNRRLGRAKHLCPERVKPTIKTTLKHQTGVALLSVLLTMNIAVILVAGMTDSFRYRLRSTSAMQNNEQAWWYALSGEELATKALLQDLKDDPDVTHLGQYWASDRVAFPVGDGFISGGMADAQACFNLNSLHQEDSESGEKAASLRVFQSLLEHLEIETYAADQIAEATRDWVNESRTPVSGRGAGDDHYQSLPVSYLAANTQMRDISEWRAVMGVSPAIAQRLLPYLCAIPAMELAMNVNTISEDHPELLAALFAGELSVSQSENLLSTRPRDGWPSLDAFLHNSVLSNTNTASARDRVVIHSNFFEVDTRVESGSATLNLRSLLWRKGENEVVVIRRRPSNQA